MGLWTCLPDQVVPSPALTIVGVVGAATGIPGLSRASLSITKSGEPNAAKELVGMPSPNANATKN
jgi:hypothetical protein